MTTTVLDTKIGEVENNIPDHAKYITTPEFNKLTAENLAARSKKADFVHQTVFDNILTSFNRKTISNKTKHVEVEKKLTITKDYNFFLSKVCFTSNDRSQNTFAYQRTLNKLELKKTKLLIMFLVGNQNQYKVVNIIHNILLSYIA